MTHPSTKTCRAKAISIDLPALYKFVLLSGLTVAIYMVLTDPVYACNNDGTNNYCTTMGVIFCQIDYMITGNLGRGLATVCIVMLGIGAMLGKVSWGLAVMVGCGIGGLFGAASIAQTVITPSLNGTQPTGYFC